MCVRRCVDGPTLALKGARASTTCGALDVDDSARRDDGRDGRVGLRQEHARPRHSLYRALEQRTLQRRRDSAPRSIWARWWASYDAARGRNAPGSRTSCSWTRARSGGPRAPIPVTYIKAWDEVRRVFASPVHWRASAAIDARVPSPSTPRAGAARHARGAASVEIEMVFMADVFVPCEACGGHPIQASEMLEVKYKERLDRRGARAHCGRGDPLLHPRGPAGKDSLAAPAGRARLPAPGATRDHPLGGRGTAAQDRDASCRGLPERRDGSLYLLDEPTTGLSGEDVRKLLRVTATGCWTAGHTVLLIEHNLDVIKSADWVIDLGPGAGNRGGEVVAMGRPADVARVPEA